MVKFVQMKHSNCKRMLTISDLIRAKEATCKNLLLYASRIYGTKKR